MTELAVITGATSGIGAEFARQLAPAHGRLWLIGRRAYLLRRLAGELSEQHGVETEVMIMDLSRHEEIDRLAERLQQEPQLMTLVNNAGYAEDGVFHDMDWHKHRDIMNVHVDATLKLCYAALKIMAVKDRGTIINVSSVASFVPTPDSPLYGPTKAFVRSLTESLAGGYRDSQIRFQALCPGYTVTDFHEKLGIDPASFYQDRGLLRAWTSGYVVRKSLEDLERDRLISIPGWNYKLAAFFLRHLPLNWVRSKVRKASNNHRYEK